VIFVIVRLNPTQVYRSKKPFGKSKPNRQWRQGGDRNYSYASFCTKFHLRSGASDLNAAGWVVGVGVQGTSPIAADVEAAGLAQPENLPSAPRLLSQTRLLRSRVGVIVRGAHLQSPSLDHCNWNMPGFQRSPAIRPLQETNPATLNGGTVIPFESTNAAHRPWAKCGLLPEPLTVEFPTGHQQQWRLLLYRSPETQAEHFAISFVITVNVHFLDDLSQG